MGRRTKRLLVGTAVLALVVVAVAGVVVVRSRHQGWPEVCKAMDAPVRGIGEIAWDNGMTLSGSEWEGVLTDGLRFARRRDRVKIATAVQRDDTGFKRLMDAVPPDLRPAFRRLRSLTDDADAGYAHRKDAQVSADIVQISRYATDKCEMV